MGAQPFLMSNAARWMALAEEDLLVLTLIFWIIFLLNRTRFKIYYAF